MVAGLGGMTAGRGTSGFCNTIILNNLNLTRHEMSVPNDVVGSVIGKRGSKINEIRQIRFESFEDVKQI